MQELELISVYESIEIYGCFYYFRKLLAFLLDLCAKSCFKSDHWSLGYMVFESCCFGVFLAASLCGNVIIYVLYFMDINDPPGMCVGTYLFITFLKIN